MAVSVGELVAVLALKDLLSPAIKSAEESVTSFAGKYAGSMRAVGQAAGVVAAAIAGATVAVIKMGEHGADIADVQTQFMVLNDAIGNTSSVMGPLRSAFANTVSDFKIMESTNRALSLGLKSTGAEMELTAKAARVLADRTGGDARQAYETLNMAMATGMDRQLKSIGLNIDGAAAVDKFAAALGKEKGELNEVQQTEAKRTAILQEMTNVLRVSGEAEVDFADRLAQAKTGVENFVDSLSVAIATSPVLNSLLGNIGDSLNEAFGGNNQATIQKMVGIINEIAIKFVQFGQVVVSVAKFIVQAWNGVNVIFNAMLSKQALELGVFIGLVRKAAEVAAAVTPGAAGKALEDAAAKIRGLEDGVKAFAIHSANAADKHLDNAAATEQVFGAVSGTLEKWQSQMEAARGKTIQLGNAQGALGKAGAGAATTSSKAMEGFAKKIQELAIALSAAEKNHAPLQAVTEKYGSAIKDVVNEATIFGVTLPDVIQRAAGAMDAANLAQGMLDITEIQTKINNEFWKGQEDRAGEAGKKILEITQARVKAEEEASEKAKQALEDHRNAVASLSDALFNAGDAVGGLLGSILQLGSTGIDVFQSLKVHSEQMAAGGMTSAQKIMAAAGALSAAQNAFQSGSAKSGVMGGAAAGASFGPLGAVLGGAVGGLLGLFGGAKKAREEMAKLKNEFIASQGGLDGLKKKAGDAGVSLDKMFAAKNAGQLKAAIDSIKGSLDLTDQAHQKLQAAVDKYGFTVAELGPKFKQQELDTQAAGLIEEYKLLIASGIENATVISKMGPAFSDYVNTAVSAGGAIPESMRATIDALFAQGKLVHENGEAFTQAEKDGLSFTETFTEGLTRAVDAIEKLVAALTGVQPPTINIPVNYVTSGIPGGSAPFLPPPDITAASGFFSPSMARDATIRVHKGERVQVDTASDTASGGGGGFGGGQINVTNIINAPVDTMGSVRNVEELIAKMERRAAAAIDQGNSKIMRAIKDRGRL